METRRRKQSCLRHTPRAPNWTRRTRHARGAAITHPQSFDLERPLVLYGRARVPAQEGEPFLEPADDREGVTGGLALEQSCAIHCQGLVDGALEDDGRRSICQD